MTSTAAVLIAALGVQLGFTGVPAIGAVQRGSATIAFQIGGLPQQARGNIKLSGPGRKSRRISTSTRLAGIAPGAYTIAAQAVVWRGSTYHPTVSVCSRPGRCASPAHGRIILKARERVTVRVVYAVGKPPSTPSVPSPGGAPQLLSLEGSLASGKSESGGWSVTISVPAGGPQTQADGVISFPIPLKNGEEAKLNYRNEREALAPKPPCLGNVDQPIAEPGNLCVYRGGAGLGSKESEDKNARFVQFENFFGQTITETAEAGSGDHGVLLVFRTNEFALEGTRPPLAKAASLTAAGSWAVTAR